jgi:predicted secreted protein
VDGVVSDTHTTTINYTATPTTTCTVTINGLTSTSIKSHECKTLDWTSIVRCGSPVTYAWKIDGVATGTSTSTSVSKTYCGADGFDAEVEVSLTVTGSGSATDTHVTTIN